MRINPKPSKQKPHNNPPGQELMRFRNHLEYFGSIELTGIRCESQGLTLQIL